MLGSTAALFSPLSSNIFVPAIPTLAVEFNQSSQNIALAVSVYLVFQAITPSFFGSMSDSWGRRPIFIGTLTIYFFANLGLAMTPTDAFWLLLALRGLQATGGSSVVSIGVGAVGDVAEPRERGGYMILGGIFASSLGWRSIFWFLVVASATVLIPLVLVYPETLRSLVGDGSIPPPAFSLSPLQLLQRQRRSIKEGDDWEKASAQVERPTAKPFRPLSAFYVLFTPEVLLVFIFISFLYMEYYCVLTIYSTALSERYGLTALQIGLCYIPGGVGCVISSILNGKQLDYYYQREEKRVGGDYRAKPDEFRIYLTRLRCLVPFTACFLVGCTALGFCLSAKAPLPVALFVNFLVGLGTGTTASGTVYGQDILPGQGGAVSASLNILRCILAALGTAFINILYNAVGAGWTFVILSGATLLAAPLPVIVLRNGDKWRRNREAKVARGRRIDEEKSAREGAQDMPTDRSSRRPRSDRPDPSLAAQAAEARANGGGHAPPPPAPTIRDVRLANLDSLSRTLDSLISNFRAPPPGTLTFQPDAPQKLAFTPSNAPVLAHEDALVKLLTQLDGVESDGDDVVRAERKRLVKEVDAELERLDGIKKAEMERAADRAGKGDELREKKARVDRMLKDAAKVGAKTEHAAKAYAANNEKAAQHEVAEHALSHNEHGKRAEQSRGRGSPRSGDEAA
ncbi:hypothetical protein RQP46_010854 [Phenoliferia psychrophenolica]